MQLTSARWKAAVQKSHRMATRFELWSGVNGSQLGILQPSGGSVTEDGHNAVRRQMTFGLLDPDGSLSEGSWLTPWGNEVRPFRGLTYPDGSTELVQCGALPISDVDLSDTPADYLIAVTCVDRAGLVARAKISNPYPVVAGVDLGTAIRTIIQMQVPQLNAPRFFNFVPTPGIVTPLVTLQVGDDPWAICLKLATDAGYDLFFDAQGICCLIPVPDPATLPVAWEYVDDRLLSMIEDLKTKRTNRGVYNHIIVLASGTGIPVPMRADAWDDGPTSPTYIGPGYGTPAWVPSVYGDVINVINSSTVTTLQQAEDAASAALRQALGLAMSASLSALVNPAHLVNDVISVTRARSTLDGVKFIMDAVTIPFTPEGQLQTTLRLVV